MIWEDKEHERDHRLECHWNTPIAVDGFVYGSSGRHSADAELRCVELETGRVVWRRPGLLRSSLTLADGKLLALTEIGALLLIRATPEHYEELARIDLGPQGARMLKAPCWASPGRFPWTSSTFVVRLNSCVSISPNPEAKTMLNRFVVVSFALLVLCSPSSADDAKFPDDGHDRAQGPALR